MLIFSNSQKNMTSVTIANNLLHETDANCTIANVLVALASVLQQSLRWSALFHNLAVSAFCHVPFLLKHFVGFCNSVLVNCHWSMTNKLRKSLCLHKSCWVAILMSKFCNWSLFCYRIKWKSTTSNECGRFWGSTNSTSKQLILAKLTCFALLFLIVLSWLWLESHGQS